MTSDQYKQFIIDWNNTYVIDFLHRREKNIVFNSPEHRAINLLDLYTQYIEKFIALDINADIALRLEKTKELEKGNWISSRTTHEEQSNDDDLLEMFDNMDLNKFNNNDKLKIE